MDVSGLITLPPLIADCRIRHPNPGLPSGAGSGTYDQPVPASASPRVQQFGRFVDRALREARERGMDTDQIEERTGVPRATIYRWRRAEIENPQRALVEKFCVGLGINIAVAGQILGWQGSRPDTEPEPTLDPEMRAVMRRLNDPSVPEVEKINIREMLRYLARGGSS